MKILVIGENGQLGKSIKKSFVNTKLTDQYTFIGRNDLDLTDSNNVSNFFNDKHFDLIINCAAYTAVEKAESDVEIADRINHLAVKQIAKIANTKKIKVIHFSTDYVFDGKKQEPYVEIDKPNPINIYGKTKLAGEKALQLIMPYEAIIIRTSWLYSEYGNNFVNTIMRLGTEKNQLNIVNDQIGVPTYAGDLAIALVNIIQNKDFRKSKQKTQIYHYSNNGYSNWYDFAKTIVQFANIKCKLNPIKTENYPTNARRPKYTLMSNDKILQRFSLEIPSWRESLKSCIMILNEQNE